jgi:hypothetical protein
MLECGRYGDFAPKPNHWIQIALKITHGNFEVVDHGHFEMGTL